MQEAHDIFYNKTVHIKLSLLYVIVLCCIYLNKSIIISLLKNSGPTLVFLCCYFLSVLCVKSSYEEDEYQDYSDT
jgi:hypothetical protein